MHVPIPKSHFYHRPSAHARNYGKMHGSHPNFEKLTIDFMLGRHYKCAFYTVICGIFITSLLSDLSLRVVTYDRTVVLTMDFTTKPTFLLKKGQNQPAQKLCNGCLVEALAKLNPLLMFYIMIWNPPTKPWRHFFPRRARNILGCVNVPGARPKRSARWPVGAGFRH